MNQELMNKYTKQYGIRFSMNQKKKFSQVLKEDMKQLGYECRGMKKYQYKIFPTTDYFFGDIKTARNLIVIPYDTLDRKFWKNVNYYPLDGYKNVNKNYKANYLPLIIFYVVILVLLYGANYLFQNNILMMNVVSIFMTIAMVLLVYMMLRGFACRYNVNKNSASIVAALELAKQLNSSEKSKVAFVFTDKNKNNHHGAKILSEELMKENRNPNIICLDCLGVGTITAIAYTAQNRKLAADLGKYFKFNQEVVDVVKMDGDKTIQTMVQHFKKAVVISSGELDEEKSLVVKNVLTTKDKTVDENRIQAIIEMLSQFIKKER